MSLEIQLNKLQKELENLVTISRQEYEELINYFKDVVSKNHGKVLATLDKLYEILRLTESKLYDDVSPREFKIFVISINDESKYVKIEEVKIRGKLRMWLGRQSYELQIKEVSGWNSKVIYYDKMLNDIFNSIVSLAYAIEMIIFLVSNSNTIIEYASEVVELYLEHCRNVRTKVSSLLESCEIKELQRMSSRVEAFLEEIKSQVG